MNQPPPSDEGPAGRAEQPGTPASREGQADPPSKETRATTSAGIETAAGGRFGGRVSRRLKKPAVAGGLVAALVALGMFLGSLLNGLGLGPGGGGRPNHDGRVSEERPAQPRDADPDREITLGDVVTVRIEEDELYVQEPADGGTVERQVSLERLIELAKRAPGNAQGIRVRIERGPTSIPIVENRLEEALREAGLTRGDDYRFVD